MSLRHTPATVLLVLASSCSGIVSDDGFDGDLDNTSIAIVGVNVVPMDRSGTLDAQTVLIADGRITAIGPSSTTEVPSDALRINGTGKYLIPGLIDMHVHIRSADLKQYLGAGVTSVRNMGGYEKLPDLIRDVDEKVTLGPRIFSLSASFDGSPGVSQDAQLADDPKVVASLVNRQYDLGYREIKVYTNLPRSSYDSVVAVARRKGMTWAGHVPTAVGLTRALESGQRSIEHLGGYTPGSPLAAQAAATVRAGTYNCPTLAVQRWFSSSQWFPQLMGIVSALHSSGARLLVGTDSGIGFTQPGESVHAELELFVDSGLTPYEALRAATMTGAEYLGQGSAIGTIEVGKEADLVLLGGNPLADIRAVRNIDVVIVDGRVLR